MLLAPIPANDTARLTALRELEILDTAQEERYAAVVRLAALVCGTTGASITLIDRDRQWFKAALGVELCETPRDISFCGHTILQDTPLVVEDATQDARFHDNPLVTQAPFVRFYAGQRLLTPDGFAVGTLCVYGDTPRQLSAGQLDALSALATQAESLLELRLHRRELEREVQAREQAERAADSARAVAAEANEAKTQFLARMSHELRTPLNAIIGFSGVLKKNRAGELTATNLSYVERIGANGRHLLQLVDDVLDLRAVQACRDELRIGGVELPLTMRETAAAPSLPANDAQRLTPGRSRAWKALLDVGAEARFVS